MMDCQTAVSWMAGWVDAQLSPGEHELMHRHLQRCPPCRAQTAAMHAQHFVPPNHVLPPGFWDRMDRNLHQAMQKHPIPTPDTAASQPRSRSSMSIIYALVLLVALGWGLQAHSALQHSRAEIVQLQAELDRAQRLTAQPDSTAPQNHQTSPSHHARGAL